MTAALLDQNRIRYAKSSLLTRAEFALRDGRYHDASRYLRGVARLHDMWLAATGMPRHVRNRRTA